MKQDHQRELNDAAAKQISDLQKKIELGELLRNRQSEQILLQLSLLTPKMDLTPIKIESSNFDVEEEVQDFQYQFNDEQEEVKDKHGEEQLDNCSGTGQVEQGSFSVVQMDADSEGQLQEQDIQQIQSDFGEERQRLEAKINEERDQSSRKYEQMQQEYERRISDCNIQREIEMKNLQQELRDIDDQYQNEKNQLKEKIQLLQGQVKDQEQQMIGDEQMNKKQIQLVENQAQQERRDFQIKIEEAYGLLTQLKNGFEVEKQSLTEEGKQNEEIIKQQLKDLKIKDKEVDNLLREVKAMTKLENEKSKEIEMLNNKLAHEQAKVAQKQQDLSNLMKSSVEGRRTLSAQHSSQVVLLQKKTRLVTCITMKVRDLLHNKLTKLQNDLESQIAAGQQSNESLMALKEERDQIETECKTIVENQNAEIILLQQSLETAKVFSKDSQKSTNLMIGLFKHLSVKLNEKNQVQDKQRGVQVSQQLKTSTQRIQDLEASLRQALRETQEKDSQLNGTISLLTQEIKNLEDQKETLIKNASGQAQELQAKIEQMQLQYQQNVRELNGTVTDLGNLLKTRQSEHEQQVKVLANETETKMSNMLLDFQKEKEQWLQEKNKMINSFEEHEVKIQTLETEFEGQKVLSQNLLSQSQRQIQDLESNKWLMQSQVKSLQETVQDLEANNRNLESQINQLQLSTKLQTETQLQDLKIKDATVENLLREIKNMEAKMTRREEEKTKDIKLLNNRLAQEQAKVAQKIIELSNLMKNSVEGRKKMSAQHSSEVVMLQKKARLVTCITMKVRDLLHNKLTKLQNELENQIAAGQQSTESLKTLKEEKDQIESSRKTIVDNLSAELILLRQSLQNSRNQSSELGKQLQNLTKVSTETEAQKVKIAGDLNNAQEMVEKLQLIIDGHKENFKLMSQQYESQFNDQLKEMENLRQINQQHQLAEEQAQQERKDLQSKIEDVEKSLSLTNEELLTYKKNCQNLEIKASKQSNDVVELKKDFEAERQSLEAKVGEHLQQRLEEGQQLKQTIWQQVLDLKTKDAEVQSLFCEIKSMQVEMTRREEEKSKNFEMLKTSLAQKQSDLSNLMMSSVEGRKTMSAQHSSEVILLQKKARLVTCITMKVRDLLHNKLTKLQNELENQIAAGYQSNQSLMTLKEEKDQIESSRKTIVENLSAELILLRQSLQNSRNQSSELGKQLQNLTKVSTETLAQKVEISYQLDNAQEMVEKLQLIIEGHKENFKLMSQQYESQLSDQLKEMENLRQINQQHQLSEEQAQQERKDLQSKIEDAQKSLSLADQELLTYKKNCQDLEVEASKQSNDVAELKKGFEAERQSLIQKVGEHLQQRLKEGQQNKQTIQNQLEDLKMKDAEVKAMETQMKQREEQKSKDLEMLNNRLNQKQQDLSNLMKSSVEGRRTLSAQHSSEVVLLQKKTRLVTCITMKVRDLLSTKITKLQNDLQNQIAAGQQSNESLISLKEERDQIKSESKTVVENYNAEIILLRQSLETAKIFSKDSQKSTNLMIGLFKHLSVKLNEKIQVLVQDKQRNDEVCDRLTKQIEKAEKNKQIETSQYEDQIRVQKQDFQDQLQNLNLIKEQTEFLFNQQKQNVFESEQKHVTLSQQLASQQFSSEQGIKNLEDENQNLRQQLKEMSESALETQAQMSQEIKRLLQQQSDIESEHQMKIEKEKDMMDGKVQLLESQGAAIFQQIEADFNKQILHSSEEMKKTVAGHEIQIKNLQNQNVLLSTSQQLLVREKQLLEEQMTLKESEFQKQLDRLVTEKQEVSTLHKLAEVELSDFKEKIAAMERTQNEWRIQGQTAISGYQEMVKNLVQEQNRKYNDLLTEKFSFEDALKRAEAEKTKLSQVIQNFSKKNADAEAQTVNIAGELKINESEIVSLKENLKMMKQQYENQLGAKSKEMANLKQINQKQLQLVEDQAQKERKAMQSKIEETMECLIIAGQEVSSYKMTCQNLESEVKKHSNDVVELQKDFEAERLSLIAKVSEHLQQRLEERQSNNQIVQKQLEDLQMKDAEVKAMETQMKQREEQKSKDLEMLNNRLNQKQQDLSNLMKSSVEGRRTLSAQHSSEVILLQKKTRLVTCITMKVRDLLYTKMTKLQNDLESQIAAGQQINESLMTVKEERDQIKTECKSIVENQNAEIILLRQSLETANKKGEEVYQRFVTLTQTIQNLEANLQQAYKISQDQDLQFNQTIQQLRQEIKNLEDQKQTLYQNASVQISELQEQINAIQNNSISLRHGYETQIADLNAGFEKSMSELAVMKDNEREKVFNEMSLVVSQLRSQLQNDKVIIRTAGLLKENELLSMIEEQKIEAELQTEQISTLKSSEVLLSQSVQEKDQIITRMRNQIADLAQSKYKLEQASQQSYQIAQQLEVNLERTQEEFESMKKKAVEYEAMFEEIGIRENAQGGNYQQQIKDLELKLANLKLLLCEQQSELNQAREALANQQELLETRAEQLLDSHSIEIEQIQQANQKRNQQLYNRTQLFSEQVVALQEEVQLLVSDAQTKQQQHSQLTDKLNRQYMQLLQDQANSSNQSYVIELRNEIMRLEAQLFEAKQETSSILVGHHQINKGKDTLIQKLRQEHQEVVQESEMKAQQICTLTQQLSTAYAEMKQAHKHELHEMQETFMNFSQDLGAQKLPVVYQIAKAAIAAITDKVLQEKFVNYFKQLNFDHQDLKLQTPKTPTKQSFDQSNIVQADEFDSKTNTQRIADSNEKKKQLKKLVIPNDHDHMALSQRETKQDKQVDVQNGLLLSVCSPYSGSPQTESDISVAQYNDQTLTKQYALKDTSPHVFSPGPQTPKRSDNSVSSGQKWKNQSTPRMTQEILFDEIQLSDFCQFKDEPEIDPSCTQEVDYEVLRHPPRHVRNTFSFLEQEDIEKNNYNGPQLSKNLQAKLSQKMSYIPVYQKGIAQLAKQRFSNDMVSQDKREKSKGKKNYIELNKEAVTQSFYTGSSNLKSSHLQYMYNSLNSKCTQNTQTQKLQSTTSNQDNQTPISSLSRGQPATPTRKTSPSKAPNTPTAPSKTPKTPTTPQSPSRQLVYPVLKYRTQQTPKQLKASEFPQTLRDYSPKK